LLSLEDERSSSSSLPSLVLMRLLVTTFRFLHCWTTLPFLRDKEDVFLLPKHFEREEEEVKEVKEEIIYNRVSKLNGVARLLYIYA